MDGQPDNSAKPADPNTEFLPITLCATHFKPPTETYDLAGRYRLKADSRADTLCFGKGLELDYLTGQQVNVDGFHSSMTTMKNIPIGSAYPAMDHPNRNTYILHAHEGLCFFDSMEHSLLPPAQLWNIIFNVTSDPSTVQMGSLFLGAETPRPIYTCLSPYMAVSPTYRFDTHWNTNLPHAYISP